MTFSERFGYRAPAVDLGHKDQPISLKNGLWDVIVVHFFQEMTEYGIGTVHLTPSFRVFCNKIWFGFYREATDDIPSIPQRAKEEIKYRFFNYEFDLMYDFLEYLIALREDGLRGALAADFNMILERERAAFRFSGETLVAITDEVSRGEIEVAVSSSSPDAIRAHVTSAAQLFSQRPEPDYRNSIKESVSAVESAVQFVIGRKAHGVDKPLRAVAEELDIHPALTGGFEKLYAYTSDGDGIRHGMLEKANISQEDARYMLVSCAAFANFLVAKRIQRDDN